MTMPRIQNRKSSDERHEDRTNQLPKMEIFGLKSRKVFGKLETRKPCLRTGNRKTSSETDNKVGIFGQSPGKRFEKRLQESAFPGKLRKVTKSKGRNRKQQIFG